MTVRRLAAGLWLGLVLGLAACQGLPSDRVAVGPPPDRPSVLPPTATPTPARPRVPLERPWASLLPAVPFPVMVPTWLPADLAFGTLSVATETSPLSLLLVIHQAAHWVAIRQWPARPGDDAYFPPYDQPPERVWVGAVPGVFYSGCDHLNTVWWSQGGVSLAVVAPAETLSREEILAFAGAFRPLERPPATPTPTPTPARLNGQTVPFQVIADNPAWQRPPRETMARQVWAPHFCRYQDAAAVTYRAFREGNLFRYQGGASEARDLFTLTGLEAVARTVPYPPEVQRDLAAGTLVELWLLDQTVAGIETRGPGEVLVRLQARPGGYQVVRFATPDGRPLERLHLLRQVPPAALPAPTATPTPSPPPPSPTPSAAALSDAAPLPTGRVRGPVGVPPPAPYTPLPLHQLAPLAERLLAALGDEAPHYAIVVKRLRDGAGAAHQPDRVFYAASLFKLAVLYELYHQRALGLISFDEELPLTEHYADLDLHTLRWPVGSRVPVADLARAMITYSDNAAANLLLDRLGAANLNAHLAALGLRTTRITPDLPTSAAEMAILVEMIGRGQAVSPEASQEMLDLLLSQQINDRLPARLPEGVRVAHKTGNWQDACHDVGLVLAPFGPYVVAVLSDQTDCASTVAELSRLIYDTLAEIS